MRASTIPRASVIACLPLAWIFPATLCVRPGFLASPVAGVARYAAIADASTRSRSVRRASSLSPSRRAALARSRRSSSSVMGSNALVQASTAAVRVSMKFSSSGKGVPSP